MGIAIVIPSHLRAGRVLAKKAIAGAVLCVEASQAEKYRRHNPEMEIVAHPDAVRGLSLKRQWIYQRFGDVVMVDDDVHYFQRCYRLHGECRMSAEEARSAVEATAETCRRLGGYLFGLANTANQMHFNASKPFRLTGFINGCCLGLLAGSRLFFHGEAVAVEDFFVSALNAHYHRFCFVDTSFGPHQVDTFKGIGGQAAFRSTATECADLRFLQRMFGAAAQPKAAIRNRFGKQVPSSSAAARTLRLPF